MNDRQPSSETGTVADRVRRSRERLPPGERRIADALLTRYPSAGLGSAAALAERGGGSAATVVRFASRLGYDGYRGLQAALREELAERQASPLTLPPAITDASGAAELAEAAARTGRDALDGTFAALPGPDFERAVQLLCEAENRITSFGGRYTHLLAHYLDLHLRLLRPGTRVHAQPPSADAGFLVDLGAQDVCVVFDVRRYQRGTVELARFARGRGARIVLVTDPWLSPAAEFADAVLTARVEAPSPFDSLVPATALVEAVIAAVHARLGPAADARMRAADAASGEATLG